MTYLSSPQNPGLFTWVTTWPVTFTLWGRMQPTRAQGGCVVMSATDGLWKDVDCNLRLPSICKVSAGKQHEPTGIVSSKYKPDD